MAVRRTKHWAFVLFFCWGCGSSGRPNSNTIDALNSDTEQVSDAVEAVDVFAGPDVSITDLSEPQETTEDPSDTATPKETVAEETTISDTPNSKDNDAAEPEPDVTEPDIGAPDTVELPPPPPAVPTGMMFRVGFVKVIEPGFCIKTPENPDECADISNLINGYLGLHLDAAKNPMDIVGLFKPFAFEKGVQVDMSFGRGTCKRDADGSIEWCEFWGNPTFFEDTVMQQPGACTSFTDGAACYSTTEAAMDLNLAGVPLGFKEAFTSGTFAFDDDGSATQIVYAYVQGFMTEEMAKKTMVTADVLAGDVPLADLLDYDFLIENDEGKQGWYFKVEYSATKVPQNF